MAKRKRAVPNSRKYFAETPWPIFDILPRLWESGHKTAQQDGRWYLFRKDGEAVIGGDTFRDLCVNIVLAGL